MDNDVGVWFGKQSPERLEEAIDRQSSEVRYSPIASLLDGSVFGYEAVPWDEQAGAAWDAGRFFEQADKQGSLYDADRRFRESAIRGMAPLLTHVKLFIPVPARIIYDARLYPGNTLYRIEAAGLRPENVVLLLVDQGEGHSDTLIAAIRHYRLQGFRIALSGIGADRVSFRRLVELKPDYARIGGEWLPAHARDHAGESLFQAICLLARKEKIVLLAEGVAQEEQLRALMTHGVGYAQGEWIGESGERLEPIRREASERIRLEMRSKYHGSAGAGALVELLEPATTFSRRTPVSEVAQHFERHRETNGFVIVDDDKRPVGLLMKEKLHQMLAWQFGLPLYWNRPVDKIMDTQPLVVDQATSVDQLSQVAMAREPDKLYDAVVVTKNGRTEGIVSIRSLLEWVTNARMADAQSSSPLTGLPGNEPIRRELTRRLEDGRPFAILYADLDYFKWYNDKYGFHRGDDVIRFTSEALQTVVKEHGADESFVGHIGGDDFIVMTYYGNPVKMAEETLAFFEKGISSFLNDERGPSSDRSGKPLSGAALSLSLALLICRNADGWTPEKLAEYSALLKKRAKEKNGSSLAWEALGAGEGMDDRDKVVFTPR
ncbi:EAL domain-containing protein [Cohnella faecalis]|uniref:GGDEF domain-containing protein n=1 Tax=Cohnella faecalis TaxID=2315694 RepID=A0A398CUF6_9BACL|nr:EAL domain-containing protein [Cohnella faecalis]RIE02911.1 GGDEF domain-containing protein [Cohnella faecalis]